MSAAISLDEGEYTPPEETKSLAASTQPVVAKPARDAHGRLLPGHSANYRGGTRPKRIKEIEQMLNKEHRNLEGMREVFGRLKALALGEPIIVPFITAEGEVKLQCQLKPDARFMQLYLDRLLGPAKAFDDSIDLSDAPDEVLQWLGRYIQQR